MINKIRDIKAVFSDVDGVLTDGGLYYSGQGESLKKFNVKDGLIVAALREKGIRLGVVSGRCSPHVESRFKELKFDYIIQDSSDKLGDIQSVLDKWGLTLNNAAYMGDDLNDEPVLKAVGLSGCPADAVEPIRHIVDFVSCRNGGEGAFRDFADHILKHL